MIIILANKSRFASSLTQFKSIKNQTMINVLSFLLFIGLILQKFIFLTVSIQIRQMKTHQNRQSSKQGQFEITQNKLCGLRQIKIRRPDQQSENIDQITTNQEKLKKQDDFLDSKPKICSLTKKQGLFIAISFLITLLIIGLSIGLSFHLKQKIYEKRKYPDIKFSDNSQVKLRQFTIKDNSLFGQNINATIMAKQLVTETSRRRLLQGQQKAQQNLYLSIELQKQGVIVQMSPDQSISLVVDPVKLIKYLQSTDNTQGKRLLQQSQQDYQSPNDENQQNINYLSSQLEQALSQQFNQVQIEEKSYVRLSFNETTNQYEIENSKNETRLLTQRKLFIKKIWDRTRKFVKEKIRPGAKLLKKYRPLIQSVKKGALAGFATGGIAGAITGALSGAIQGGKQQLMAQVFVRACTPQKTVIKFLCTLALQVQSQTAVFDIKLK